MKAKSKTAAAKLVFNQNKPSHRNCVSLLHFSELLNQSEWEGERKTDIIILREESATSTFKEQYETFVRRKLHRQKKALETVHNNRGGKSHQRGLCFRVVV